jgi:SET and MYND domain-containing protein
MMAFNQPQQEIRALRPIKAGEEIFIKYVEVTNPFGVRQAELREAYFFTCQCTKCKKGGNLEEDQFIEPAGNLAAENKKPADELVSRHESKLARYMVPGYDDRAHKRIAAIEAEAYAVFENAQAGLEEVKEAIQICIGSKMWRWTRQPVPQLCRRLFALYLESGSFYQAFRVGVKLHCEILPRLYSQAFYPDRLINAWAVSTLTNVLCGPAHSELYQELAQGGLDLRLIYFGFLFYVHEHTPRMFGQDTPFGKVIENTYKQIMAGVTIPEADIKEKIQAIWPSLDSLAHNVTIASL